MIWNWKFVENKTEKKKSEETVALNWKLLFIYWTQI